MRHTLEEWTSATEFPTTEELRSTCPSYLNVHARIRVVQSFNHAISTDARLTTLHGEARGNVDTPGDGDCIRSDDCLSTHSAWSASVKGCLRLPRSPIIANRIATTRRSSGIPTTIRAYASDATTGRAGRRSFIVDPSNTTHVPGGPFYFWTSANITSAGQHRVRGRELMGRGYRNFRNGESSQLAA
jgi:hypothetical protein